LENCAGWRAQSIMTEKQFLAKGIFAVGLRALRQRR
jgi:hypothetical protein